MKHRLSHQQTELIQLTGLTYFGFIPWMLIVLSFLFLPLIASIIFATIIIGFTFYFSFRIYKVEFDADFLYLSRRLRKTKIGLKDVLTVKTFPFPVYLFLGQAYILSISYTKGNKPKTVFTISRGLFSWRPTIDTISELKLFREYIQTKQHGS
jgi:hypothetical protein